MKKKYLIAVVALLLVGIIVYCVLSCGGVNPSVTNQDIEQRALYNEIYNETNKNYLKSVFAGEELETKLKETIISENQDEIEETLQEDKTVLALCEEKKISMPVEETQSIAKAEFEALQTNPDLARYYEELKKVLKKHKISYEEYIALVSVEAHYKYNKLVLKRDFENTLYNKESKESLDSQFEKYIKENI